MSEFPQPIMRHEQLARVGQNNTNADVDNLFNRVFDTTSMNHAMNNSMNQDKSSIISTGQIESMNVPTGWVKRGKVSLRAGAGLVEYNPVGQENVRLKSFYRGNSVSDEAASAFKDCLNKPPHLLKPEELKGLSEILRDKAYDFKGSAKTEDLNGKRVLVLEGRYSDEKHTSTQTIYVDSDGTGSAIQEIAYTASGKDYTANLVKAQKAFKSIVWKSNKL
jgi:hypothetical protein